MDGGCALGCPSYRRPTRPADGRRLDAAQAARFALVGATLHGPFFWAGFRWLDATLGPAATLRKVGQLGGGAWWGCSRPCGAMRPVLPHSGNS